MPFFSTLIFFFDSAGRVVRLAASVGVSDMHIPTVLLLLYGRVDLSRLTTPGHAHPDRPAARHARERAPSSPSIVLPQAGVVERRGAQGAVIESVEGGAGRTTP